MGAFDDLIPSATSAPSTAGGAFDDLVPMASPAPQPGFVERAGQKVWRTIGGGLRDFAQNTYDFAGDAIDLAYEPATGHKIERFRLPDVAQPDDLLNAFVRGGVQLGAGAAGPAAALKAGTSMVPAARGMLAGAVADLTATDPSQPNLSNIVEEGTGLALPTAKRAGENPWLGRAKDVAEGGVLGGTVDTLLTGLGRLLARSGTDMPRATMPEPSEPGPDLAELLRQAGATDAQISAMSPSMRETAASRVQSRQTTDSARAQVPPQADMRQVRSETEAVAAGEMDPAAVSTTGYRRAPLPETLPVDPQGRADTGDAGVRAGVDLRGTPPESRALVPVEPQIQRMTPEEVTRARAAMNGGNPNRAEGMERAVVPPDRAPQTPSQAQDQRMAADAFRLADAQRGRAEAEVRDTQPAGRPDGVDAREVFLDDGFPVEIVGRRMVPDSRGRMVEVATVRRADPRTGQPGEGAVEYDVPVRQLERSAYAPEPRRAQDFATRAEGPPSPETPRTADQPIGREPDQTYRATMPDPNTEFPGAGPGRSPLPEQPDGPFPGRRWSSAEEAVRDFQERQARGESGPRMDGDAGARYRDAPTSNKPKGMDRDGAWVTDDGGFVVSSKGGPVRFADQKQAGRWILSQGQAKSKAGQYFEIANHPSGKGFTVRERGRDTPRADRENNGGGARPSGEHDVGILTVHEEPKPGRDGVEAGPFGPIWRGFRHDARGAVDHLLHQQDGEALAALHHPEVGDVDLVWGDAGTGRSDGYGLAKIAKFHPEVLGDLQSPLNDMRVVSRTANRIQLESDTHRAGIRLGWDGQEKVWLLSEYDKREFAKGARGPAGTGKSTDAPGGAIGVGEGDLSTTGRAAANVRPDVEGGKGGPTLYANPMLDPAAWRTVSHMLSSVARWTFGSTREWGDALGGAAKALGEAGSAPLRGARAVASLARVALLTSDGAMRALARDVQSPTLTQVLDHLHVQAGDHSGRAEDLLTAVRNHTNQRMNDLGRLLGEFIQDDARLSQIVRLVQNGAPLGASPMHKAAQSIRTMMSEELTYLREAGVDIGEVKRGYFPREYDRMAVVADKDGFLGAATRAYRQAGHAAAREAAEALFDRMTLGGDGSPFGPRGGSGRASFLDGRVFGKAADDLLRPYLVQDPVQLLSAYFARSARRAEAARRFGDGWSEWGRFEDAITREVGASRAGGVLDELRRHVSHVAGLEPPKISQNLMNAMGWVRTWGALIYLPKATISSLSEALAPGVRSGSVVDSLKAVATTAREVGRKMARMEPSERHALAEDLGLVLSHHAGSINVARFVGEDLSSAAQEKIMRHFFRRTGLDQWTEATRAAAVGTGQTFIRRMAKDLEGGVNATSRRMYLRELGVPPGQEDAFARWVVSKGDGLIRAEDMTGDLGRQYRTALVRFVDQSIMNPTRATRPRWAATPLGSLLFQLQSYNYTYGKNVLMRYARNVRTAVTEKGLGIGERAEMLTSAFVPLMAMSLVAAGIGEVRDAALGDPVRRRQERPGDHLLKGMSRASLFGGADQWVNWLMNARYQKDLVSSIAGPAIGLVASNADVARNMLPKNDLFAGPANSDRTNTAERRLARAAYDLLVEPTAQVLLTAVPVSPLSMVLTQVPAAGSVREAFVSGLAGPQTATSSGRPGRRDSHRSSRAAAR